MRATIIQIGNSRGIRLPRHVLKLFGIEKQVELERVPEGLLIKRSRKSRSGWSESFAKVKKEIAAEKPNHAWLNSANEADKDWQW